ncbi:MAG: TolB family protein [Candidatus Methanofastidiosia archaeon]
MRYDILLILAVIGIGLISGCVKEIPKQPPAEIPKGVLVKEIPETADILFTSIRYVLNDLACLDDNYHLKDNFVNDADCSKKIYDPKANALASPRQLYAMDIEERNVIQITNMDCFFTTGQVVDSNTIMTDAACLDTDGDGIITDRDKKELYLLDLVTKKMDCLTCGLGLDAINNPDYSHVNKKIVFSAQKDGKFHNYLFTIDANKNLSQITDDGEYMDFDCSWSEDGTKIVFSRLPLPAFSKPTEVWLMDSDGTNREKITNGGSNPNNEGPHGVYPIGIDADPDLSPDNKKIVFSRLITGKRNEGFGVYELIIIDVDTKREEILDSRYANMVPEWKSEGILFIRQVGATNPMDRKQSLYIYKDGKFVELEEFPYNVFPIGAYGGSWIEWTKKA